MADTDPHAGIDMGDAAFGAALSNATAAGILCETCEVADFYTETQRAIFRAIVMLRQVGGTPDERVVADALPAHCNYILGLPGLCRRRPTCAPTSSASRSTAGTVTSRRRPRSWWTYPATVRSPRH